MCYHLVWFKISSIIWNDQQFEFIHALSLIAKTIKSWLFDMLEISYSVDRQQSLLLCSEVFSAEQVEKEVNCLFTER